LSVGAAINVNGAKSALLHCVIMFSDSQRLLWWEHPGRTSISYTWRCHLGWGSEDQGQW